MNQIRILFYATFREISGARQVELTIAEGAKVKDLRTVLGASFPQMALPINSALVAINREFAFDDDVVPQLAEVAIFPPVSGGADNFPPTLCAVTGDDLELNSILEEISLPSHGAACIFTGMVRGITTRGDAHETICLEYEAYQEMAVEKMHQIANEMRQRWREVDGIAIVQRIGKLYPRTPTVVVACTAAHRDTGVFEAARYGIERLKEIVPIWKKEIGPEGEEWIEGDYFPRKND